MEETNDVNDITNEVDHITEEELDEFMRLFEIVQSRRWIRW